MGKKKKQYIEEQIFNIYPDFPLMMNDQVIWSEVKGPMHFHYYLEIAYCMEGSGILKTNNDTVELKQGDITVVASNMLHTTYADAGVYTRWANLYVDLEDLVKLFPIGDVRTQLRVVQEFFTEALWMESVNHPEILWILQEIIRLCNEKKRNYKMEVLGLLYTLIFKIYNAFSDRKREDRSASNLPIMPAIEYIYAHYMEPIKVADLAKACHFSESYFRKVFVEMKGMGPMDYLNSIRIRESCKRLLNTTDTVRMIGEKCGYPSVTTFERNFKQRMGVLPSQWRETQQNPRKKDRDTYEIKRIYHKDA